jgi:hypothetical protein
MQRCLEHAADRRCSLVQLDATKDGVALYARLGFRPSHLVGTCRGRIEPPQDEARQVDSPDGVTTAPVRPADLAEMTALEARALGANRQALLSELIEGGRGTACRDASGDLGGFLLYREGFHSVQVGPLIARDEKTAGTILRAAFRDICSRAPECEVTMTVPLYNEAMLEELKRWGLPVTPRLTRMFRGWRQLQAREDMVYALSGPEKG